MDPRVMVPSAPLALLLPAVLLILGSEASTEAELVVPGRHHHSYGQDLHPQHQFFFPNRKSRSGTFLERARTRLRRRKEKEDPVITGMKGVTDRTCPDVTALDRRACGSPQIDKCHCKQLGCCWAGDDPFTNTLQDQAWHGVSACYFLYGGFHAITDQLWSVPLGQGYNLTFPSIPGADAGKVRFLIIPGNATCGKSSISSHVESNGAAPVPQGGNGELDMGVLVSNVKIAAPGKYKVCMNDDKEAMGLDEDVFFTVNAGQIEVYEEIKEVLGPCST